MREAEKKKNEVPPPPPPHPIVRDNNRGQRIIKRLQNTASDAEVRLQSSEDDASSEDYKSMTMHLISANPIA